MKTFLFFLFLLCNTFAGQEDTLLFIIRVDDILSRNVTTLPRRIKDFQNAVELRGGKVTWAVIPHRLIESQNLDGVVAQELRETLQNGHEIAMHGYNHICLLCGQSGHEMFCTVNNHQFSYEHQVALVDSGLRLLLDTVGITPRTFVPPAHVADSITYSALLDRSFNLLSSTGQTKSFIYRNLYNLAPNNEYTWQLTTSQYSSRLASALNDIRNTGASNGYYCLLLHDPFIRQGYENGLVVRWTGELLDSLNVSFGGRIKYVTLQEAFQSFNQPTNIIKQESVPGTFSLSQNYPNPFNPSTVIKYQLPADCRVTLNLFDILGNRIAMLVDEYKQAGIHSYELRISDYNITSGIYFYEINAGNFRNVKKMIFIK